MHITRVGSDFITIDEDNLLDGNLRKIPRVHLIQLNFKRPDEDKVRIVLSRFPLTKRFIIDNNVRFYNYILKRTSKKYYIMNNYDDSLISFFRRNNKVLLNFYRLNDNDLRFVLDDNVFQDILRNVEVIIIAQDVFDQKEELLNDWNGNVIIK